EIFRLNLRKAMRTAFQRQAINFPARASRPKRARAMFAGSGTAVKSSSQLAKVLCSPVDMSAKNSVQLPFGFWPVYELKAARLAESKAAGEEAGSMFRPSGVQLLPSEILVAYPVTCWYR